MDTTRKLALFETSRANLPPGCKVIIALRDYSLVEILSPDALFAQRVAVIFDHDRDPQILSVLGALAMTDRDTCMNLLGLAETRGRITSFVAEPPPPAFIAGHYGALLQKALQHAATAALWPDENWIAAPPTFTPMKADGTLDRTALAKDSPLLVIPERYALGRVQR